MMTPTLTGNSAHSVGERSILRTLLPDIYLTRLKALRDIGFPLAEQMEYEEGKPMSLGGSEEGTLEYRKIYLEHLIAKRELSQN